MLATAFWRRVRGRTMIRRSGRSPKRLSAQDRVERGDYRPARLDRIAQLDPHRSAHRRGLLGRDVERRVARVDFGIDADAADREHRLVATLREDVKVAVERGGARTRDVDRELRAVRTLAERRVGEAGGDLELALA